MAMKFGIAAASPAPVTESRIVPATPAGEAEIATAIRLNEAENVLVNQVLEGSAPDYFPPGEDVAVDGDTKLDRLVADDFPFDQSQLDAIQGVVNQQYACLTGAAGTGKTTCTKKVVQELQDQGNVGAVDMTRYFKRGTSDAGDADDDYVIPTSAIPSIALVGFTGRSTQMIKKNFPDSWHGNIMTIHRMLAYVPERYEDFDAETGDLVNKMRFVPTYTSLFLLPWDIIIIDEAGMTSVDLWENVWAAAKPGCRIFMIGDINQLPPVHGRSIFGFALAEWPSFELTHVHRQAGANNSIVDNAHRILKGQRPVSDGPPKMNLVTKTGVLETLTHIAKNQDWKFLMVEVPEEPNLAGQRIRKVLELLNGNGYDPIHDSVISAINGHDGSRGQNLGQIPMNRELAIVLNKGVDRYIIDAGRERKQFAVGDKVMATKNDHTQGITNGMTGIITQIERNGAYAGDLNRYGKVSEIRAYMESIQDDDVDEDISLDEISDSFEAQDEGREKAKEAKDRGPASHVVTVRFGEGNHVKEIGFGSLSEVATLMTAYVVTCHKMQGGESPLVMSIVHQAHKAMMYREWGYTALTRASQRAVFFYTDLGLRVMLNKQRITGVSLAEKIKVFKDLSSKGIAGAAVTYSLPERKSLTTEIQVIRDLSKPSVPARAEQSAVAVPAPNRLEALLAKAAAKKPIPVRERIIERTVYVFERSESDAGQPVEVVDGGTLHPTHDTLDIIAAASKQAAIEGNERFFARLGMTQPVLMIEDKRIVDYTELLTNEIAYSPAPVAAPTPVKTGLRFGVK